MEQIFSPYLVSPLSCQLLKDWNNISIIFSPSVLTVLGRFPQETYSEVEICLQVNYWLVLLETALVREWGKQNWAEREGEQ